MNGNNALLVSQQTSSFLLMFMIIYKKVVETENTMTMATANEKSLHAAIAHKSSSKEKHTLCTFSK